MPADPTDDHAPHIECENCGKPTHLPAACPCGCGIRVCSRCENTVRRHQAARVVAGRPDQPAQTTPLFEGTVASVVPTVVGDFHIDIATTDDSNLPALGDRVTVYATDPHTPGQETPDA